jgi:YHS domain-containing protein
MKTMLFAFLLMMTAAMGAPAQTPVTVLKGFDPIELVDGREVAGTEAISSVRGKYRYLFSSEANRGRFLKSPADYQIQMGGGCGRMGSLSGAGNPDRFWVFNRRIYIFASEQCRNSFKAAPENHLETPDAAPRGTAAEKRRGKELLALALRGLGGAKVVDAVETWQAKLTLAYNQSGKVTQYPQIQSIAFPGRYRNEYDWGGSLDATVLAEGRVFNLTSKETWEREVPVKGAFERALYRHPLAIVKARRNPGFLAVAAGTGKAGDADIELLTVAYRGATSTLGLDPKTGRILQIAYRDRQGAFGDRVQRFSDFRDVAGLSLPYKIEERFNGNVIANPAITVESIAINLKLDAGLFRR